MPDIFDERQRRNIFRVVTSYALVSWVVIQAASAILPAFGAPDWMLRLLFVLLAVAFPPVIGLCWVFSLIKRRGDRTMPTGAPGDKPAIVAGQWHSRARMSGLVLLHTQRRHPGRAGRRAVPAGRSLPCAMTTPRAMTKGLRGCKPVHRQPASGLGGNR